MSSSGFQISRSQEMFPVKLMHILHLIDTKEPELSHIISWQSNGITFRIHDKKLFEKLVKQRGFFNQKSYSSFRRQLNLWGFKKIGNRCKADCGVYGHPMFLRDYPHLCKAISRISRSGGYSRKSSKKTGDEEIKALIEQENAAKIISTNYSSEEEEACSSFYYNSTSSSTMMSWDDNYDTTMLQELDCFDTENNHENTTLQQELGYKRSSSNRFNSLEDVDEDAYCEIEPFQLDEDIPPLPSSYGKYICDALRNNY